MIGTIEFASATVYRYATINVGMLRENLGDDAVVDRAIELFVDSFVRSMPTGKITTFANRTLPDAVLVQVRNDQLATWTTPRGEGFSALGAQVRLVDLGSATVDAVRGER